jgi:hypothetical protein
MSSFRCRNNFVVDNVAFIGLPGSATCIHAVHDRGTLASN